MQILSSRAAVQEFLASFAPALLRDPHSWRDWYAVQVTSQPLAGAASWLEPQAQVELALILRRSLTGTDGMLLVLDGTLATARNIALCHCPEGLRLEERFAPLQGAMQSLCLPPLELEALRIWEEPALTLRWLGAPRPGGPTALAASVDGDLVPLLIPDLAQRLANWPYVRAARAQRRQPYLLIIDDDPVVRRLARCALKNLPGVATAPDVVAGVEKHLTLAADIVFLDIEMPVCDGFFMLDFLRRHDPDCQVVMFSAHSFLTHKLKAFSGGARGFVPKPFSRASFEYYISAWHAARGANERGGR